MPLKQWRIMPFQQKEPSTSDSDSYFNVRDRKILGKFNVIKMCDSILAKCPYHFNILFVEPPPGSRSKDRYLAYVQDLCLQEKITIPGHITFAKNNSTGSPLSCFMILHCIGHALFEVEGQETRIKRVLRKYNHEFANDNSTKNLLSQYLDFASARESNIESMDELVYELVACHLWYGRIKTRNAPREIRKCFLQIDEIIEDRLKEVVGTIIADFSF